jgi:predicted O-methyltransferase YrrM
MDVSTGVRAVRLALTRPGEFVVRVRNRLGRREPSTLAPSPGWQERLEELFGHDHEEELAALRERLGENHIYDADPELTSLVYAAVRALRAETIVETGVARGLSTRYILEALEANNAGSLWSIDLPPEQTDVRFRGETWAAAVEDRRRWQYVHGHSRRVLPKLLRRLGEIDVFVNDSEHSQPNMFFEYGAAWRHLRSGGLLISDDVHMNAAWETFFSRTPAETIVCEPSSKAGLFGLAIKP